MSIYESSPATIACLEAICSFQCHGDPNILQDCVILLLAFCGFVCSVSLPPEIVDRIMDEHAVGDFVSRQHLRIQDVPFRMSSRMIYLMSVTVVNDHLFACLPGSVSTIHVLRTCPGYGGFHD